MKRFGFSIESYKPKYRRTKMTGPNPNAIYPNEAIKSVVFIKNVITRPNILVGDYTYYDDVNFMDIKVISTLGLTEDDLEDIIHIHFLASVHIPGLGIVAAWTMVQASGTIY